MGLNPVQVTREFSGAHEEIAQIVQQVQGSILQFISKNRASQTFFSFTILFTGQMSPTN